MMLAFAIPGILEAAAVSAEWTMNEPSPTQGTGGAIDAFASIVASGVKASLALDGLPFFIPAVFAVAWCAVGWTLASARGPAFWFFLRRFPQ